MRLLCCVAASRVGADDIWRLLRKFVKELAMAHAVIDDLLMYGGRTNRGDEVVPSPAFNALEHFGARAEELVTALAIASKRPRLLDDAMFKPLLTAALSAKELAAKCRSGRPEHDIVWLANDLRPTINAVLAETRALLRQLQRPDMVEKVPEPFECDNSLD